VLLVDDNVDAGFDHHLTKPAEPAVVAQLLAGFVPAGSPHRG